MGQLSSDEPEKNHDDNVEDEKIFGLNWYSEDEAVSDALWYRGQLKTLSLHIYRFPKGGIPTQTNALRYRIFIKLLRRFPTIQEEQEKGIADALAFIVSILSMWHTPPNACYVIVSLDIASVTRSVYHF